MICAEGEWRRVERGGRSVEARKKPGFATHPGETKNRSGERAEKGMVRGGESGSGDSSSLPIKKNKHGEHVGVRKLWGTRKKVSVEDVKEHLGEKFDEAEKVEVVRVCKEESGRTRRWFWLKGEEDGLEKLDGVVMDGVWKVEKRSPFLGIASVRVLSR